MDNEESPKRSLEMPFKKVEHKTGHENGWKGFTQ